MAFTRPGCKTIQLICVVCEKPYVKDLSEAKRNLKLGRANLCGRSCQAVHMNKSPAKLEQTREMLKDRNSHQWREDNAHWKGGVSGSKLKPLPEEGV